MTDNRGVIRHSQTANAGKENSGRGLCSLAIAVLACFAMAVSVAAQNIQYTQGSIGSGLENTLQIPLRAYPGRGAANLPVTLTYSSRVWRINHLKTVINGTYIPITEAIFGEHSVAGWKSSLDIPEVEWPKNEDTYYYTGKAFCQVCGSNFRQFRVAHVYINMPNGEKHELRKGDQPYEGPMDMYGTFYAVDGSRLRYDSSGQNSGTLYFPDGTRYVLLSNGNAQYIDRNGNALNYDSGTRQWSDTLGRPLGLPLPANPQAQDYPYTLPGIDGPINYTFRWKTLANALTPDPVTGLAPTRKPIANEYLPNPSQPPTGPGGGNYPQYVQTSWSERPSLFISGSDDMDEGYTIIVGHNQNGGELFNPVVLAEIILPNGLSYKFTYNINGEIDKITYPTGAFDRYQFGEIPSIGDVKPPYTQANRGITSRKLSADGSGNDLAEWTYSTTGSVITSTAPNGMRTETYRRNYPTPGHNTTRNGIVHYWPFGFEDARQGREYEERVYAPVSQGGAMLRRKLIDWAQTSNTVQPSIPELDNTTKTAYRNARSLKEVSLILDTSGDALAKTIVHGYDTTYQLSTGLDLTLTTESFFASVNQTTAQTGAIETIPAGLLASSSETAFQSNAAYRTERNILGLPISVLLKDPNGQVVSKTEYFYDEGAYPLLVYGDLAAPDWIDPNTSTRANLTTVRRYTDIGANLYLETHTQYDQCGNSRNTWNERGVQSQADYSAVYKHALLTQTTSAVPDPSSAHGSNSAFTSSSTFDYTSGLKLTSTDANGQVTTFSYKNDQNVTDPLNRLRKITRPDGGWTKYDFSDALGDLFSSVQTKQDNTHISIVYQYADPSGRPSRSFMKEDGTNYIASDTLYDNMGRVWKTSNPYRTTQRDGFAAESHTSSWTTTHYDALSRTDSVTLPDGSIIQTSRDGIYTTVTDQAGKKRRQKENSLGQIVRIDEPDVSGNLGTLDSPAQATFYDYDTAGKIVHVTQGTNPQQHRYFKYDALGRLTHERQVEQVGTFNLYDPLTGNSAWSRKLVYDETINSVTYSGLLTRTYDARNTSTQFQYDQLNRVWQVAYSDGTPTVTNNYDQERAGYFNKSHLTEALTSAVGSVPATGQIYNCDLMGRTANNQQIIGSQSYSLSYSYNLGGALTSETYPSGRVVSYAFDDAARTSQVSSGSKIYANQFDYTSASGLLKSMTLGNGAVQSFDYNSRMQVKSLDLTRTGSVLQHYDYKYGVYDPNANSVDESKNNGQIATIEGTIGSQKQWQQNFTYDSIGRLSSARELRGDNNQQSYLVNYEYDLFGNRYQKQSRNAGNPFNQIWTEDADVNQATNRFASGASYDDAGNVLIDQKYRQLKFQYDANNRQKQSSNLNDTGVVVSVYDAGGQRVGTQVAGAMTNVLVYDAMGALVAEYGSSSISGGTQYVMADHEGSTRAVLSSTGTVLSRHDYLPFGEEIYANVGMRTDSQGYNAADSVRQKYAGMETDEATGMAHTLWRQYDSLSGRWTSPDPYGGSMTVADPQSFNRYSYVGNNPVNLTDPTGMIPYNGADQSWADVAGDFWGWGDLNNQSHNIGREIVENGMNGFLDRQEEEEEEEVEGEGEGQNQNQAPPPQPVPAGLQVVSVEVLTPCSVQSTDCGTPVDAPHGIYLAITYQVVDKAGNPIRQAGLVPKEKVGATRFDTDAAIVTRAGKDGDIGPNLKRNSKNTGVTDANGQFVDAPFGISTPVPLNKATVKQEIYFKDGKQKNYVRTNNITVTGTHDKKNKQYIYTISNGSDINETVKLHYK